MMETDTYEESWVRSFIFKGEWNCCAAAASVSSQF